MRKVISAALPAALLIAGATPSFAATEIEVASTSNANGWTVTQPASATSPSTSKSAVVVNTSGGNAPANWGDAVSGTNWISWNATGRNDRTGSYIFSTTFSLAEAATYKVLEFLWKSDNYVEKVVLNGVDLGPVAGGSTTNQFGSSVGPFSQNFILASSGASLQNSNNSLQIYVNQRDIGRGRNDVGLSARITAAVPEPGTWMLVILGLGAVGFAMRRRPKTAVRLQFA